MSDILFHPQCLEVQDHVAEDDGIINNGKVAASARMFKDCHRQCQRHIDANFKRIIEQGMSNWKLDLVGYSYFYNNLAVICFEYVVYINSKSALGNKSSFVI